MPDKYIEKQVDFYNNSQSEEAKDNALYRLGTYLEVIECDGNATLTDEKRSTVLDAVQKAREGDDD
jgi:hypothetical protein